MGVRHRPAIGPRPRGWGPPACVILKCDFKTRKDTFIYLCAGQINLKVKFNQDSFSISSFPINGGGGASALLRYSFCNS